MELWSLKDRKSSGSTDAAVLTRDHVERADASSSQIAPAESYRLYKRRWAGLVGLVSQVMCDVQEHMLTPHNSAF